MICRRNVAFSCGLLGIAACMAPSSSPRPAQPAVATAGGDVPIVNGQEAATGEAPGVDPIKVPIVVEVRPPVVTDIGDAQGTVTAVIETTLGVVRCKLDPKRAPMTVANFIGLASGTKAWAHPANGEIRLGARYYDGLTFHRVIPDFMIQGGDPLGTGIGGPGYKFVDEIDPSMKFDAPGILAMANAGPASNGSQFFITEKPTPWLNGRHTIFGRCDNIDVIKTIARVDVDGESQPVEPVTIQSIHFQDK